MKEIYKELKSIFDEYGSVCLGIATLIVIGLGMTFLITCAIVAIFMWLFGLTFSWTVGMIVWITLIVVLKIIKNHVKNEIDKNKSWKGR